MALGKAEAQAEYANLISRANAVMEMARQSVEENWKALRKKLLSFPLRSLKSMAAKSDDKEAFLLLVKQVVAEVKDYDDISIYVDPEYYETVHQHMDEIQHCYTKNAD